MIRKSTFIGSAFGASAKSVEKCEGGQVMPEKYILDVSLWCQGEYATCFCEAVGKYDIPGANT